MKRSAAAAVTYRDEADANHHHDDRDDSTAEGRRADVAVANGGHGGDRPPHSVPRAGRIAFVMAVLDRRESSSSAKDRDEREHRERRGRPLWRAAVSTTPRASSGGPAASSRKTRVACSAAGRNGGVSKTIATSRGLSRSQRHRSSTTLSIRPISIRNAVQIVQFRTTAVVSSGSPTLDCSMTMVGMVSSAAASSGHCSRRSIACARSFTPQVLLDEEQR